MRGSGSVIFFVFLIVVMGCTSSPEPQGGAVTVSKGSFGLVVDEFRSDVSVLEEEDISTLTLRFTNINDEDATNIASKIYPVGLKATKVSDLEQSISRVESNSTDFFEFDLKAPKLNIDRTFSPYVILCYNYRSTATSSLFVVDNDVYDSETVPIATKSSSIAPVTMDLSFSSGILKILTDSTDPRQKTLTIALSNVDTGYVIDTSDKVISGNKDYLQEKSVFIKIPSTGGTKIKVSNDDDNSFVCSSGMSIDKANFKYEDIIEDDEDIPTWNYNGVTVPQGEVTANSANEIGCMIKTSQSFGSRGDGRTLRLPLTFNIDAGGQDLPFFIGEMDYRYCLQSEQLTIQAKKFV